MTEEIGHTDSKILPPKYRTSEVIKASSNDVKSEDDPLLFRLEELDPLPRILARRVTIRDKSEVEPSLGAGY